MEKQGFIFGELDGGVYTFTSISDGVQIGMDYRQELGCRILIRDGDVQAGSVITIYGVNGSVAGQRTHTTSSKGLTILESMHEDGSLTLKGVTRPGGGMCIKLNGVWLKHGLWQGAGWSGYFNAGQATGPWHVDTEDSEYQYDFRGPADPSLLFEADTNRAWRRANEQMLTAIRQRM